jgi:hypothetical protein
VFLVATSDLLCGSGAVTGPPTASAGRRGPLQCQNNPCPAAPQVGPPCLPLALGPLARAPALHTLSIAFDMRARGINPDQVRGRCLCYSAALRCHIHRGGLPARTVA